MVVYCSAQEKSIKAMQLNMLRAKISRILVGLKDFLAKTI
jgi:hypothetical protein